MESPIRPGETVITKAELDDLREANAKLRAAVTILDDAVVEISNWPDGGGVGQRNIKRYATERLNEARRARWN